MTMNKVYQKLRKNSKGQYALLSFCIFLSVVLITSFALMYFGPTVQEFCHKAVIPEKSHRFYSE